MDTEVLGFIVTNTCNFRCRHCCNESAPEIRTKMAASEILNHIAEAAQSGRFREVGISGGEPFLFPKEVLAIVQEASSYGLGSSITTNAYWARTDEKAAAILSPLVKAGLTSLAISVSAYHLEFTSMQRLISAARAAVEAKLSTFVNVVVSTDFTLSDAYTAFVDIADQLTFVPMPCIPAGRAAVNVTPDELPLRSTPAFGNCKPFFAKMAVTPTGEVYPCCSPGGFTPPLMLGNIREQAIAEIVKKLDDDILFQVLETIGPAFFLPFIDAEVGRHLTSFVDQCHLCHTIFTDESMTAVARKALEQLQDDLRQLDLTFYELIETQAGSSRLVEERPDDLVSCGAYPICDDNWPSTGSDC